MQKLITCPDCDGTGEVHSHNPKCSSCNGIGTVTEEKAQQILELDKLADSIFIKKTWDYEL